MTYVLKFLTRVDGTRDEICGRYFVSYDPAPHLPSGDYDGGKLVTTANSEEALTFDSLTEALEAWKEAGKAGPTCACHNTRPDGKPNRPLTIYTVLPTSSLSRVFRKPERSG